MMVLIDSSFAFGMMAMKFFRVCRSPIPALMKVAMWYVVAAEVFSVAWINAMICEPVLEAADR